MVLTPQQAQSFYDRFGIKQDSQAFYEDGALDELIAHADFANAKQIFELGCGTGRFALRLLSQVLSEQASYQGVDISDTMVKIAAERLAPFVARAQVNLAPLSPDGALQFALNDASVDRVVSTYVLDLLSEQQIQQVLRESRRVLSPQGKLCLVSLSVGDYWLPKLVARTWNSVFRISPSIVGGCRPLALTHYVDSAAWRLDFHQQVSQFGVPSEILIATPIP